jgi:hypothetical protein
VHEFRDDGDDDSGVSVNKNYAFTENWVKLLNILITWVLILRLVEAMIPKAASPVDGAIHFALKLARKKTVANSPKEWK